MTSRHLFTFLGIVLALTLVPSAQAANLFIDDSVEAQITLNHDANFEFGVTSNGLAFGGDVSGSTTATGESATFSGGWIANSAGNPDPGTGIIYFVDQAASKHSCMTHRRHHRRHHHHHHHSHGDVRGGGGSSGSVCVSDIVRADWSGSFPANITFTITSSACGQNLGRLPRDFAGLGVPDPTSPIEISGLFRDPDTAAAVAIPSNLTVQFVGNADTGCKSHDDGDDHDDDHGDDHDEDDD